MVYLVIMAFGGLLFVLSSALGWENGPVWAFFGTPALFLVAWLVRIAQADARRAIEQEERHQAAKDLYETTLKMLALKPGDQGVRIKCLDAGRMYYEMAIPDTQTMQGNRVILTTDNSANRESRIQADINARIGHLKAS